jgi:hypothetical protein
MGSIRNILCIDILNGTGGHFFPQAIYVLFFPSQQCQQPFSQEDIVVLNGSSDDLDAMRTKLKARQARRKAERKTNNDTKHRGKVDTTASSTEASNNNQDSGNKLIELSSKNHNPKEESKSSANGEKGSQKSKLQNEKSDLKTVLKVGSKLNGMLIELDLKVDINFR